MTTSEDPATSQVPPPKEGTGAHFAEFLNWAETKGELPSSTTRNWRNATTVVFEVEDGWRDVDLTSLDVEAVLERFTNLRRTKYTEGSLQAYKSRVRASLEAYRKWVSGSGDWKPTVARSNGGQKAAKKAAAKSTKPIVIVDPTQDDVVAPPPPFKPYVPTPPPPGMITYPFPVRPGVQCQLVLPEDLTEKEANRVVAFVKSLAFAEPRAITAGPSAESD